jgi:quercetin dioxygenase-like cupin family protein
MERIEAKPTAKGPAERFTGDVWVTMIAEGVEPSRLRVGLVRFAPAARTAWHCHALGQTLHVTDGTAVVQARGGEVILMRPGDTVHTPPGEWHWHGAAPDTFMAHMAMSDATGEPDVADVQWGEHVSDEEYRTAAAR